MKKTWVSLCLAAFLALPLAGCGGDRTGSVGDMTDPSPSPAVTAMPDMDRDGNGNPGDDDLAGADGIVGDDALNGDMAGGVNGAGDAGNGYDNAGQADNSPLEDLGDGVQDTLDDIGSAARGMGRDAQRALER